MKSQQATEGPRSVSGSTLRNPSFCFSEVVVPLFQQLRSIVILLELPILALDSSYGLPHWSTVGVLASLM